MRANLTAPVLSSLTERHPSASAPRLLQQAQKPLLFSGRVAVPVALAASALDWLMPCPLWTPLVLLVVSALSTPARWARWAHRSQTRLTVPYRLIAVP